MRLQGMSWRVLRCYKTDVVKVLIYRSYQSKQPFLSGIEWKKTPMREYISYISAYFAESQLYQLLHQKAVGHLREGNVRTPCTLPLDPPMLPEFLSIHLIYSQKKYIVKIVVAFVKKVLKSSSTLVVFQRFLTRGQKHPVNKAGKKTAISLIKVDLP